MRRAAYFTILPLLAVLQAAQAQIDDRMTLTEAIEVVRSLGFDVSYSSQLVKEWMLVRKTPANRDPVAALDEALSEYRLAVEAGPNGGLLIVEAQTVPRRQAVIAAEPVEPDRPPDVPAPPLEEITIVASRYTMFDRNGASDQFLTGEEIRRLPHIADDTFRAFHRLPGVAASDYRAPFNLRGGAVDEVMVQLNGLELVEPYHMRTLFSPLSIVDPGIIDQAQLLSGGFTVQNGNYLSGTVDMSTIRPDLDPVHEIGVSFVSAFARSRGRLIDDRGRYFLSLRRGYLDLIADQVTDEGEELSPRYGDLFAYASYEATENLEIEFQALVGDDDVTFVDPGDGEDNRENSTIQYYWLSANYEPWTGISSRSSLFLGGVDTVEEGRQLNAPAESIYRRFDRALDKYGLRTDWQIGVGDANLLLVGGRYRHLAADYDYDLDAIRRTDFINNGSPFAVTRNVETSVRGSDAGLYAAWRSRLATTIVSEVGVRWDRQTYANTGDDEQWSPRFNVYWQAGERTELRLAWGRYFQPQAIQDLHVEDGETFFYRPERVEQSVLGIRHSFDSGLLLQADIYDKQYDRVRPRYENLLDIYEFAPESNFDRVLVSPDESRAYGVELTLRSNNDTPLDWWINYTWSKAEDVVDGTSQPRSWDQRNAVTANLSWTGARWTFSAVARYHSGWPRTLLTVSPIMDASGNTVGVDADISNRNVARFDDYTRIDVRVSRTVPLERGSFEYYFEVFNVFDSKNQCCISNHTLNTGPSLSVSPLIDDYLPRFPSFGFVWRFGPGAD